MTTIYRTIVFRFPGFVRDQSPRIVCYLVLTRKIYTVLAPLAFNTGTYTSVNKYVGQWEEEFALINMLSCLLTILNKNKYYNISK